MSDYTKVTDFAAKDSLLAGDPNKLVKGTEFDAEFNLISTAIATKADGDSPAITNGTINSTTIGATTPSSIVGTTVSATSGFTGDLTGDVTGDLTGNVTAAAGTTSLNNLSVGGSVTGTLSTADVAVTGNITVSGTVDGRDIATDGTKLDGIEAGATGDQTAAEIKTAYESNADTNALTDFEKTKLGTVETGADVTDATNVDAAGAVMNSDATTASMSFVIDEDSLASNLDTKVPTQQSVKAYVDNTVVSLGGLTINEPVSAGEFGVFTSGSTIGGQTPAEVRASLDLEVGTDVQAWDADLDTIAGLAPTDGHFLQYSGGTWTSAEVATDTTLGTLTKTFATNEAATITLSSSLTDSPVVSVVKEIPQVGTSTALWNVNATQESYARADSAPATTLDFVFSPVSPAYNSVSFSVAAQALDPEGLAFNNDGTKMFVINSPTRLVYEYNLSAAFNLSTASYNSVSFDVSTEETSPRDLAFNNDGTKMFIVGQSGDEVNEYNLTTGFDISTASASQVFDISAQLLQPQGIAFNNDGTSMFVVGWDSDAVFQYDLTTGFDVSTASYASKTLSVATQDPSPSSIAFNSKGTRMYVLGLVTDAVFEYTLTTPFDLSTASYTQVLHTSIEETSPQGLAFSSDYQKMYIVGNTQDTVFEYDSVGNTESLLLGTGSFASADVGKTIEANSGTFVLTAADGSYTETTAPTSYDQVASGDWEMYSLVFNTTDDDLEVSGITLSTAEQGSVETLTEIATFSVNPQEANPSGVTFSTDGTKMFIVGSTGDDVNEYNLSSPWDITTASFTRRVSVSAQTSAPRTVRFSPDGTKMFVLGNVGTSVYEYNLATAFNVSTAAFSQGFSVGLQETDPNGFCFNHDGTKMYVVGRAADDVFEYNLSTPFAIGTATYFQVFVVGNNPEDIVITPDGTKMVVVYTDRMKEFALATPFDVSTASLTRQVSEVSNDLGAAFNTDASVLYTVNATNDTVYASRLGSQVFYSGYSAAVTKASIDSTYWTDINSMTVTDNLLNGLSYYAVSTDNRTTWSVIDDTNGVRDIVRNNAGTWEYNSNATYALETWTAGATNTELATLEEAMGTSQNRMDKTQLEAVTDANHYTLSNDLDLAIVLKQTAYGTAASSDGVSINYDANTVEQGAVPGTDYLWDSPESDKVRITALQGGNYKVRVV